MKNFFSEIDNTTLTHSDFGTDENGVKYIRIYFERPCDEHFFDYLESEIPGFEVKKMLGFSPDEVKNLLEYAMRNSFLMWDKAHKNAGDFVA